MTVPLKDFRLGITESIDIWLDAEAIAFGTDKAAVAREILQEWAKRKAHAYKVATHRLHANGLQPELPGLVPEDDGAGRQGSRR
jgi:hypothetical protein